MIELLSLQFGNIRSFVDDQTVSLKDHGKLIQIDGRNENTGGSSGAGKTTILLALDYLLGISEIPSTVLQSRLTKESLWASGDFLIDSIPVTISRSKKDGLIIKTPTETISGNSKIAEEKLQELINLPIKIFKKMIHKKQKEGGFFLNMTPKEIYEFLISVLGLEKYITHIEDISAKTTILLQKIDDNQRKIELTRSSILDLERILSEKKPPECAVDAARLNMLDGESISLAAFIMSLKDDLADQKSLIEVPGKQDVSFPEINAQIAALVPLRVELKAKIDNIDQAKSKLESELSKIPLLISNAKQIGDRITSLKEEKAHISNSQYPTCMQNWVGNNALAKIMAIDEQISMEIHSALNLKEQIDKKPSIEADISRLNNIRADFNSQLEALQIQRSDLDAKKYSMMENASNEYIRLKADYDSKISFLEQGFRAQIEEAQRKKQGVDIELSSIKASLHAFETAKAQYEKEITSINEVISKKRQEISSLENDLFISKKQIIIADESRRLIKTYVLQTFQETLDAIGEQATQILSSIPNMATSTIYFEGCRETKAGIIKDEIVAILNSDGINDIPIKSLSGGERTAIDLAIDLAVIDVIESKVSKGANFLFLDEPFDGLDSVSKENCLEILKQLDTNKKIIMIDHSSELKEMVSDVIMVVKNKEKSNIAS